MLFLAAVTESGQLEWNGGTGSYTIRYAGIFEEGGVAGGKHSSSEGFGSISWEGQYWCTRNSHGCLLQRQNFSLGDNETCGSKNDMVTNNSIVGPNHQ